MLSSDTPHSGTRTMRGRTGEMWRYLRSLRNRGDRDTRPLPYVDPIRAGRHPFQVYLLGLCVVSGFPYLFGQATAEAVDRQLPVFLAAAWGLVLLIGAATALVGTFWRGSIANALTMERIGLYATGWAALVYGLCIVGARSVVAPALVVGMYVGYFLLRMPVTQNRWRWGKRRLRRVEDALTVAGLLVTSGFLVALVLSPAVVVLVGAFILLGFGGSCLSRAHDLADIFHHANATVPSLLPEPQVEALLEPREGAGGEPL